LVRANGVEAGLTCSFCTAPMEKGTRRHSTLCLMGKTVHKVWFPLCKVCDSLVRLFPAEKQHVELTVAIRYAGKIALGGGG